ncbi:GNAT family N-acetyltransferase [Streptacidiphilus cavernicola]|uniref:GNAT family N-acetyltransferase n=1 Tax=Streptacidiphilus cavernicola TaxID=3342716 RepID=A0ABV6W3I3_9ACTN
MADDVESADKAGKNGIQFQDDGRSLLEALIDGRQAGRIDYFLLAPENGEDDAPAARVGVHTVVQPAQEGQGIGGRLAVAFYRAAAAEGRTVVPLCPYLKHWAETHPDQAPAAAPELIARAAAYVETHSSLW